MSISVNQATILGNVGKDPVVRTTEGGNIASFSVATTKNYTDRNGQRQENTTWHDVVCFGRLADVVRDYVRSGMRVYIFGEITKRTWDDKDGVKHERTEIRVNDLQMLSRAERQENPQSAQPAQNTQRTPARKAQPAPDYDLEPKSDDLPF